MRLTILATQAAAAAAGVAALPPRMRCQLLTTTVARCMLLAFFFSFCIVYFFPSSGFMGVMAMVMVSPPLMKAIGDRQVVAYARGQASSLGLYATWVERRQGNYTEGVQDMQAA